VPLEAMASGCPVIATCMGGSSEYCLDGVNCVRVPLETPLPWHMQCGNWLKAETSSSAWWKVGYAQRHAPSIVRRQASSTGFWPLQALPARNQSQHFHHYCLGKDDTEDLK
jgi:hypothetical protein